MFVEGVFFGQVLDSHFKLLKMFLSCYQTKLIPPLLLLCSLLFLEIFLWSCYFITEATPYVTSQKTAVPPAQFVYTTGVTNLSLH